jgi:hypothetical protein
MDSAHGVQEGVPAEQRVANRNWLSARSVTTSKCRQEGWRRMSNLPVTVTEELFSHFEYGLPFFWSLSAGNPI